MDRVNTTQDAKAAADHLQNRIALENAYIQQNQTQLDMMERFMHWMKKSQVKNAARNSCIRQNRINNSNTACS